MTASTSTSPPNPDAYLRRMIMTERDAMLGRLATPLTNSWVLSDRAGTLLP
jgi:hypothetical protein